MSLICIRICNLFPFESLCTRTPFETEACSKSEMGYLGRCQKVKLQEGDSGLRLAVNIKRNKKTIQKKQKMKKNIAMDTKLWCKLRSTYAPYQQRLISLRDSEVYFRKNTIFLIMKIYF